MLRAFLAIGAAIGVLGAPAAGAKVGTLTQLPGKAGCVTQQDAPKAAKRDCIVARFGGHQMWAAAVSPDGRSLYVGSIGGAVSVLSIRHGVLHQLPGKAGCVSGSGEFGCRRVGQLHGVRDLAVSPDGRSVYLGAVDRTGVNWGVVIFARDRRTGALRKVGCVGEGGSGGCVPARAILTGVSQLVVSRDARSVYVASNDARPGAPTAGAVAVFDRSRGGALSQPAGAAGCTSTDGSGGCGLANGLLPECCGIAVSPDSRSVYVSSSQRSLTPGTFSGESASFALAAFSRGAGGVLTQLAGTSGCANRDGSEGCAAVPFAGSGPLNEAGDVLISPDGRNLYLAHSSTFPEAEAAVCGASDNFIAVLPRDATGALGALAEDQPSCGGVPVMSPDGRNVYAVTGDFGQELNGFVRDPRTGRLTAAGCFGPGPGRCRKTRHLTAPSAMAITPDGRYAYVVSDDFGQGETIGVFRRSLR
jgi:DNA-binding beta-propeller fold protein YncE